MPQSGGAHAAPAQLRPPSGAVPVLEVAGPPAASAAAQEGECLHFFFFFALIKGPLMHDSRTPKKHVSERKCLRHGAQEALSLSQTSHKMSHFIYVCCCRLCSEQTSQANGPTWDLQKLDE